VFENREMRFGFLVLCFALMGHRSDRTGLNVGRQTRSTPAISPSKNQPCKGNVRNEWCGKLVNPPKTVVLSLESFDVQKCSWSLEIEEKFASGGFRNAFLV
jgi:hypothetical protein